MEDAESKIRVRPIEARDYEAVLSLSGNVISREEIIASNSDETTSLCFVAEDDGKIVGFNLAHHLYVGIPLNKICVIQGVVVHENYRRLGIGEKLIEAIFEKCHDCGTSMVRALVEENDLRLKRFIEHLGFRVSSVINYDKRVSI